jgi:hypothetical protein
VITNRLVVGEAMLGDVIATNQTVVIVKWSDDRLSMKPHEELFKLIVAIVQ